MNTLNRIMAWYESNCNDDWEHSYGIKIDTLDNPGWVLYVDLSETELEKKIFQEIDLQRSETDWVYCTITDCMFKGAGGVNNLEELLLIFLEWVES